METKISPFKFDGYLIKHSEINISEEIPDAEALKIEISPKGIKNGKEFTLILHIAITNDSESIRIEMEVYSYFSFKDEVDKVDNYFTTNAPALVFPYIRGYISLLTSISGSGTITLPTLNLMSLGEELKSNIQYD